MRFKVSIQVMGLLFFGVLFYISWIYFKERMLNFDPSAFCFWMIETKTFYIMLDRWTTAFSQVIPLIALKNHCSLISFLKLYSVSFVIIQYLIFLCITLILRNYRAGILLMFALGLSSRLFFYYSTEE